LGFEAFLGLAALGGEAGAAVAADIFSFFQVSIFPYFFSNPFSIFHIKCGFLQEEGLVFSPRFLILFFKENYIFFSFFQKYFVITSKKPTKSVSYFF